jgi:hypothetical protein
LKEFMSMVYNAESEAITTNRTDIGEYWQVKGTV